MTVSTLLNGAQIVDQPIDQSVDARTLRWIVDRLAAIELPAPDRHVTRSVCRMLEASIDGPMHIHARNLAAPSLRDTSEIGHMNLHQRRHRAVTLAAHAMTAGTE